MITTRTRILSFLATVAMLVSMLACFVIPASALAASQKDAWQAVLLALDLTKKQLQDADPETGIVAYSYGAYSAKNYAAIAGDGENPGFAETEIKAKIEAGTLNWKAFNGTTVSIMKNLCLQATTA